MEPEFGDRKIAAILAADIAGYSRLAAADEERTLARLRALRSDLIDPAIAMHHGRVVKRTGDGILIEFRSVVEAARCALEVQAGMLERNAGLPPERRIEFRVGIHLGDVVEESDGDLMGDAVNVAARLEGIAKPGTVLLSQAAFDQIKRKVGFAATDLGERSLKNIAEPVHVFCLEPGAAAPVRASPMRSRIRLALVAAAVVLVAGGGLGALWAWRSHRDVAALSSQPAPRLSVVVLTFANLSGDPRKEYFAEGITDDVTTALSRIRGSFVIARSTARTFEGTADTRQIAKELGVRYVLQGSVQRDGTLVRVNAQLVDGASGQQIWAERLDAQRAELFDLQNQITARIANSLRFELVNAAMRQSPPPNHNVDALDLAMQARALRGRPYAQEELRKAEELYERALALDPGLVEASSGLADTLAIEAASYPGPESPEQMQRAEEFATRARVLDPDDPDALIALAIVGWQQRHLRQSAAYLEQAISIDPNYFRAYANLGLVQLLLGHPDKAIALFEQGMRLSPRDPSLFVWQNDMSWCYILLGDDKAAIAWGLKARSANARFDWLHANLAAAYALSGDEAEAKAAMSEALRLNPHLSIRALRAWTGDEPEFVKIAGRWFQGLRKAGMPEE